MADQKVKILVEVESDELKGLVKDYNETKQAITDLKKSFLDGKIGQEEYSAKLKVLSKDLSKDFKDATTLAREQNRALLNEWKRGAIAGGEFQKASGQITQTLRGMEAPASKLSGAFQYLWHTQNQVTLGTKSLLDPITAINQNLGPLGGNIESTGDKLRTFYREQRVGDRTMRETGAVVQNLTGLMGESGLGRAVGTAFSSFQQMEFATNAAGIALESKGGKVAKLGSGLLSLAGPLAITGAGILLIAQNAKQMEDRIRSADDALRELKLRLGDISKEEYLSSLMQELKQLDGEADKIREKAEFWASLGFKLIPSLLGISEADAKETELRIARLRDKINELTGKKSPEELAKANIALAEKQFKLGDINRQTLIDTIRLEGRKFTSYSDQLDLRLKIQEIEKGITKEKRAQLTIATSTAFVGPILPTRGTGGRGLGAGAAVFKEQEENWKRLIALREEQFKQGTKEVGVFERVATNAFANVGNTAAQTIGRGFVDAFGIGHTLLGQFVNDVISQFTRLAAMGLIKGIFSAASGGGFGAGFLSVFGFNRGGAVMEPVFGVGARTGQAYAFAETEPEYIVNRNQMGALLNAPARGDAQLGRVVGDLSRVLGRLKAVDPSAMAYIVDKGNQYRSVRQP